MTEIPRNLKNDQNTPYFGLLFRFQSILVIFQVLGYFGYIWVSRVFWSFFKKKCFKGILVMFYVYGVFLVFFYVSGGVLVIFQFWGVFRAFFRFRGYLGLFLGLRGILVIFQVQGIYFGHSFCYPVFFFFFLNHVLCGWNLIKKHKIY